MKVAKDFLMTQDNETVQLPSLDKVELRALLQLLNKKVDSTTQLFPKDIIIQAEDIYDLNYRMSEKLKTSNSFIASTVVSVKYNNQKTMQFTTWEQFQDYSWEETSSIRNITLIWEFFVDIDGYQVPQKHTVVVRISSGMKMEEMLQLIMTGKIEEIDSLEQSFIPIVCRVDFVNTLLADEIINLVDKWNKGLRVPNVSEGILYKIKQRKKIIISFIRIGLKIINWAIILLLVYQLLGWLAKNIIQSIQDSLIAYGKTFTFDITKEDKKIHQKIEKNNKESLKNLAINTLSPFIVGVLSSIVATMIIDKLLK